MQNEASNSTEQRRTLLQYNRGDGEKLSRGGELDPVVHLFPVGQKPGLALIWSLKRRSFYRV